MLGNPHHRKRQGSENLKKSLKNHYLLDFFFRGTPRNVDLHAALFHKAVTVCDIHTTEMFNPVIHTHHQIIIRLVKLQQIVINRIKPHRFDRSQYSHQFINLN